MGAGLTNFDPTNPYCQGIHGILDAYQSAIRRVQLYGPTNFSPVINHVARFAGSSQDGSHYFVLLIITDGVITDMANTVESIVNASRLPMSIIIVGVGNDSFEAMDMLDADNHRLNSNGKYADRDIVQFVPFREFVGGQFGSNVQVSQAALAKEVLAEVPDQVISYMKKHGIKPRPPRDGVQLPTGTGAPAQRPAAPQRPPGPPGGQPQWQGAPPPQGSQQQWAGVPPQQQIQGAPLQGNPSQQWQGAPQGSPYQSRGPPPQASSSNQHQLQGVPPQQQIQGAPLQGNPSQQWQGAPQGSPYHSHGPPPQASSSNQHQLQGVPPQQQIQGAPLQGNPSQQWQGAPQGSPYQSHGPPPQASSSNQHQWQGAPSFHGGPAQPQWKGAPPTGAAPPYPQQPPYCNPSAPPP